MLFNGNVLPIIAAGLMNGSFVIPSRYVSNFTNERIWFYHSIIGLSIIPWLMVLYNSPYILHDYLILPSSIIASLIVSGLIFGIGQLCFAYAIEFIGVALSFTINLGIGVVIGSMFFVVSKNLFFTSQGFLVTLAVFTIVGSLVIYYFSDEKRHHKHVCDIKKSNYHLGWLLASITGFTSGLQNIAFVLIAFYSQHHFESSNSFWVWPPFLLMAALPMFFGFYYKTKRKVPISTYSKYVPINNLGVIKNMILITLMGLFFTGSLSLYSTGMSQLPHYQQIIGWPALMVSIILTSQVWGWIYREHQTFGLKTKVYRFTSILLLIIAIILLSFET